MLTKLKLKKKIVTKLKLWQTYIFTTQAKTKMPQNLCCGNSNCDNLNYDNLNCENSKCGNSSCEKSKCG